MSHGQGEVKIWPEGRPFAFSGGPTGVLLIHGFTSSPQTMHSWGQYLAKAGYTVRCPLLPGHATRWQDLNRTGWRDWYAAVTRAFDELRRDCDMVFVAGLSMGGTLALRLAEERQGQIAALVLVNPSLATLDRRAKYAPLLKWFEASTAAGPGDIKKPDVHELAYDRVPLAAFDSLRQLWRVTRADLSRVTQPVLLFRSVEDHTAESINGEILLSGIASASKEERLLRNSYHVATLDNDAETIFAGSVEYIKQTERYGRLHILHDAGDKK